MFDNTINSIQGIGKKDQVREMAGPAGLNVARKPQGVSEKPAIPQGDKIQFSDELCESDSSGNSGVEAIKNNITGTRNLLSAGSDASSLMTGNVLAVQNERSLLQNIPASSESLGMKPGMQGGGVIGSGGIQGGLEPGMKGGSVFSSSRTSPYGHQPGGGVATPNMVKLQTDYAGAIQRGASISGEGENMVLQNLALGGSGTGPVKSLLGL